MDVLRSKFTFFFLEDGFRVNLDKLFSGEVDIRANKCIFMFCCLTRQMITLDTSEINILLEFHEEEATCIAEIAANSTILKLVRCGALISPDCDQNDIYQDEISIRSTGWNRLSVFYHFSTLWTNVHNITNLPRDIDVLSQTKDGVDSTIRTRIDKLGAPPPHFHKVKSPGEVTRLPIPRQDLLAKKDFLSALLSRKTTRVFDQERSISKETLSTQLYYVFGVHGLHHVYGDVYGLKRTSPSGGCLHPTECYVVVNKVEGLESGIYHYDSEFHQLVRVRKYTETEARDFSHVVSGGQVFPATANYICVLTSRFRRNFWKYENHKKAYLVLYQDIAHLSQTNYLVCAALDLGAFYTSAINNVEANGALHIDGIEESAMAICGVGWPDNDQRNLMPRFDEFQPWKRQGV